MTVALSLTDSLAHEDIRARFPVLREKAYLNSCSYGALSRDVRAAFEDYLNHREQNGSDWPHWVQKNEELRAAFADFIGASPDEVAITASVTAGVNSLVSALSFSPPRNKIIVSDLEFPTIGQIWHAQEARGARIVHIPAEGPHLSMERLAQALDENTLVVSVTHVCYRNGGRIDVKEVVDLAHSKGALVLLDSYQALGSLPINVKELGVDILVGGSLKYMLGTAGVAFLYMREGLIAGLHPTVTGWFSQNRIEAMDIHRNDPSPTARRFEAGTPPVPNLYAALAGLRLLQQIGMDRIVRQIEDVTGILIAGVKDLGGHVITPEDPARRGAMIAIRSTDEHALVRALEQEGIVTSCRDGNLRVSPHVYNNRDDIHRLLNALAAHRHLLAR